MEHALGVSVSKCEEGIEWTENERNNMNISVKRSE